MVVSLFTFLLCCIHTFFYPLEMGSLYDSNIDLYKEKIKKPDNGYAERQIPEKIEEVES